MPQVRSRHGTADRRTRPHLSRWLLLAFAFAVMADPVSSVAYAPEAGLRALGNDLSLLVPTMLVVLGIILLVRVNYHQLIKRFPEGGGAVAATAAAFGEGWAFIPLGSLIVDFVLTIAISVAAATSALIAYFPGLASIRVPLAVGLCALVAGVSWFGHIGRTVFASMTLLFVAVALPVLILGFVAPQASPPPPPVVTAGASSAFILVLLAFPVSMASATGIEGMSSAIAQLGQLNDEGRMRSGHVTSWLTLAIQGTLTMLIALLAVHLAIGAPGANDTLLAELARTSAGDGAFYATFQLASLLLLLAAASSSFQAGPGLLKAIARRDREDATEVGILPRFFGRVNGHHTPYWGVLLFFVASSAVVIAAGGLDQSLVLFYAVAVFVSFLTGLLAMARFSARNHDMRNVIINLVGAAVVVLTILINLRRGFPIASLLAALVIGGAFAWMWIRQGRPRGIAQIEAEAERDLAE